MLDQFPGKTGAARSQVKALTMSLRSGPVITAGGIHRSASPVTLFANNARADWGDRVNITVINKLRANGCVLLMSRCLLGPV